MNFSSFIHDFFRHFAAQMQIGIIGEIQNFDGVKMRADVRPVMKTQNADGVIQVYPIIPDVPVQLIFSGGYYIRPVYKKGDLVWLTFATFDIDSSLNGTPNVESEKIFSLENCSVTGAVTPNNFKAPAEFSSESGLIIGSDSGQSYISFKDSEIDFVFGGGVEIIKMSAAGIETLQSIKAGMEIVVNNATIPTPLSTHTHPYTDTPIGPSVTGPVTPGS